MKLDEKRALKYAKVLVAFQEIGAGPMESLSRVKEAMELIREVCHEETGIMLDSYPVDFVKNYKEGD